MFTLSRSAVFTEVSPTKWETSSIHCSGQSSTATLYCNMSLVRKLVLTRVELSRPIIMRVWQRTLTHDEANTNLHSRTLCSLLLSSFGRLEVSHRTHCVVRVFVHEFSFCWNDVAGSFFFFFFFFLFFFCRQIWSLFCTVGLEFKRKSIFKSKDKNNTKPVQFKTVSMCSRKPVSASPVSSTPFPSVVFEREAWKWGTAPPRLSCSGERGVNVGKAFLGPASCVVFIT